MPGRSEDARRRRLEELGATAETLPELLRYTENPYRERLGESLPALPLADEPHLEAWRDYAEDAVAGGAIQVLREKLVQLSFPIREGISQEEAYRSATRRGKRPSNADEALRFSAPGDVEVVVHDTLAGAIPVIVAGDRDDFETLVRALTGRNEPIVVPSAMGACLIKGLVNWDRVARYRAVWAEGGHLDGTQPSEAAWQAELKSLAGRRELYQDRVLLLSTGPYSALAAAEVGFGADRWHVESSAIRLGHESFHYLTLRLFGLIRSNLLDELLADMAGLLAAHGRYSEELALRFLGLESYPEVRPEGRLTVYRGELSDAALPVLSRLAVEAIRNLAAIAAEAEESESADLLVALAGMTLEELATPGCRPRVGRFPA